MTTSNKAPEAIDVATGQKVRIARRARGMSQEDLAAACGVSFQQVQKYENGSNRISISRLFQMAEKLRVEPAALLPTEEQRDILADAEPAALTWLQSGEAVELAQAVAGLDEAVRRRLIQAITNAAAAVSAVMPAGLLPAEFEEVPDHGA